MEHHCIVNLITINTINEYMEYNMIYDDQILDSDQNLDLNTHALFHDASSELHKLPNLFGAEDIVLYCKKLTQQHHIISKKVLILVLQKQAKCKEEIEKLEQIQQILKDTVSVCKACRSELNLVNHQLTFSSLYVLYYWRKRKILESLLHILYKIKILYRTKDKLQQLLNEENYPRVISLISDCQRASNIYKGYQCVDALHRNLCDTLEQVEENLDISLSNICLNFSIDNYVSVQCAYNFLGKSETAVDQMHMYFTATLHSAAFNSVLKYTECNKNEKYNVICKFVTIDNFFGCLVELCRTLLGILRSYYQIVTWHENHNATSVEKEINKQLLDKFILQKLKTGVNKICNDLENKITIYIDTFDLTQLKCEQFIQTVNVIDRISKIVNKISEKNRRKLRECIREQFVTYFKYYHASRLEELKIFLENDGWELCPIKPSFRITQLQEFKPLKYVLNLFENKNIYEKLSVTDVSTNNDCDQDSIDSCISLLDLNLEDDAEEDILRNSEDIHLKDSSGDSDDDTMPQELKYDYVDELNKDYTCIKTKKHSGPIITNTTLSILRICGKYLQITRFFKDFTTTIIQYMIQIFELYFYAVHDFFTVDLQVNSDISEIYGTNLKRIISRIKDSLIMNSDIYEEYTYCTHKVYQPHLSEAIDLNDSSKLFSLSKRIVAIESLIFLGQQYEIFRGYLNSVVYDEQAKIYLYQFFTQTVNLTIELRKPIYMSVIMRAFDMRSVLNLMAKVNWELKDIITQHSNYVDVLIEEIHMFKSRLSEIQNQVPIPKHVHELIWKFVAYIITRALVEGFSNVKKCSNGGRALMQLDLAQFITKFEFITSLRPMPYQEYVASYIKAYYLSESSIESWIKDHLEYSSNHLIKLMACMYDNKKIKQKYIALIEDQHLNR